MTRLKKKPPIVRKYKDTITYTCPVRGEVSEELEIQVYGTGEDWIDENKEYVSLAAITPEA